MLFTCSLILLLPILRKQKKKIKREKEKKKHKKIKKILEENKKYILVRRIYQNIQEIIKNWLKKIKIYKIEKFNSVFSIDEDYWQRKFNLRRKIQN